MINPAAAVQCRFRRCTYFLAVILGLLAACQAPPAPVVAETGQGRATEAGGHNGNGEGKTMSSLAEKLSAQGYAELFLRLDQSALDQVWTAAGADALGRLVTDDRSPTLARFLAAEILFTKASGYPPAEHRPLLASIYTSALSDNYTRMANPWGMPGELDGPVGQHVVTLGEVAIVTLRPLLDDDADVTYGGSEEATFGNSYHYRVKDLAAFYISRIRGAPYRVVLDVGQRDREIARLRRDLGL